MPVILVCPQCGATNSHRLPPVVECERCHTPYPEGARQAAETTLARERAPKPALLWIGQLCSGFMGVVFLFLLLVALTGHGDFSINDEPVTPADFLLHGGGIMFGLIGGLLLAVSIGLWRDRPWTRPLMMSYWPLSAALLAAVSWRQADALGDIVSGVVFSAIAAGVAYWYLYDKANVVAYYRAIESRAATGAPAVA